ncbi:hypothetical protein [Bacillus sp. FJAT-47783]|uniref:hypothetical protein n=1 Tax=Bacillus sp. FJAT-47783 TaxID=2922712 RepID=UPI001FAB44EF|nr:hypothetical protein [Bacillus sp. FJAT-47783]
MNLAGFQPEFILYLQNSDYLRRIFIESKGRNIEEEQWKEDLLIYINEHESEIVFEDETTKMFLRKYKPN